MQISLRKTLIVYTTSIVILVATGVTVSTLRATRNAVIHSNDAYAKGITQLIGSSLAETNLNDDSVHQSLQKIVLGNEDMNAVAVYDLNFHRIAEFSSNQQTVLVAPEIRHPLRAFQSSYRDRHFSVLGPMLENGEIVSYVGADFSLARSTNLVRSAARNAIVVLSVCVTLATCLAVLLAWNVTKPIFRLIEAAKMIGERTGARCDSQRVGRGEASETQQTYSALRRRRPGYSQVPPSDS